MTNKPMLSVERELLERALKACTFVGFEDDAKELRVLLDAQHAVCSNGILCQNSKCAECGGNGAYKPATWARDMDYRPEEIGSPETEPAAQHRGAPVRWERMSKMMGGAWWPCANKAEADEAVTCGWTVPPLFAEQPAPVAPFSDDTVVCRRYTLEQSPGQNFYHYDLEPVYGSVPVTLSELISMAEAAPVAVVMPGVDELAQVIRKVDGRHTLGAVALAEAIHEEVLILNKIARSKADLDAGRTVSSDQMKKNLEAKFLGGKS